MRARISKNLGEVKICGEVVWKKFCFKLGYLRDLFLWGPDWKYEI
jgi:hypothetical protein